MEAIQEWPEPIVRVQTLADAQVIPDRYIKPPSQRPNLNPGTPSSPPTGEAVNIPVIDLGGLSGSAAAKQASMLAVSNACRDWGFFQVVNHGVSPELMRRVREAWREFFYLPLEAKQAYANSPATFEGYGSRIGVQKGAILDWSDYFFLHLLPRSIKNCDKWPALPASLRETTESYGGELAKLCGVIQSVMSMTLGLDEEFLSREFGEAGACLRVNFYPKCPQPDLTLGLSPHSDPGGMTILLADERVRGLQVRKGDAWITVDPVPNAFIVNIGDQIQVLTNATYKSVEHRVIVNAATERISLAFFYNPQDDLLIKPAKELVAPYTSALYKPMSFKEYKMYMRMVGPRGKSQVDSMKLVA